MRISLFLVAGGLIAGTMTPARADAPPSGCNLDGSDWSGSSITTTTNADTSWAIIQPRIAWWIANRERYSTACYKTTEYGRYRTDCSGFVSLAWGLEESYSTYQLNPTLATSEHLTHEIGWDELQPGDALVINSGEAHHIALVVAYDRAHGSGTLAEESGGIEADGSVTPTIETSFSQDDDYWGQFTPIRYDNFHPGVTPVSGAAKNLATNGDFNDASTGWTRSGSANIARYASGTGGAHAYEGSGYLATNASGDGGSIRHDIAINIAAGDTYCASAQLTSLGRSGGGGNLALWLLGGTSESAAKGSGALTVGTWSPVSTCVTARTAHTTIRVELYPVVGGATIGLDAVDVHRSLATNGDFNVSAGGWFPLAAGTHMVRYASGTGGAHAYEGGGWLALNASKAGGSVAYDHDMAIAAGETYCASAQVTTAGTSAGGSGTFAIWLIGGETEGSSRHAGNLPGASAWTPVTTCVTATRAHSTVRVQLYPALGGPTLGLDAVDLHRVVTPNGGFNTSSTGWARGGTTTNVARYTSSDAYEGAGYLATNTDSSGGSVYSDIPLTIKAGDSYCVTARLTTAGSTGGGGGSVAIWFMGGSNEGSSKAVSNLPGNNVWTPVTTCTTATANHTTLRVQVYPAVNGPTIGIDAVTVE